MADTTIERLSQLSVNCEDKENRNEMNLDNNNNLKQSSQQSDQQPSNQQSNQPSDQQLNNSQQQQQQQQQQSDPPKKKRRVYATFHLLNKDGTVRGTYDMKKTKITIGSNNEQAEILISRPEVYPRHAEITYDKKKKRFYLVPLVDPRVSDTIRINFVPFIYKKEELVDGDVISVGYRSFKIEFLTRVDVDDYVQPATDYQFNLNSFILNGTKRISVISKSSQSTTTIPTTTIPTTTIPTTTTSNNLSSVKPITFKNSNNTNETLNNNNNNSNNQNNKQNNNLSSLNNKSTTTTTNTATAAPIKDSRNTAQDYLKQLNTNRNLAQAKKSYLKTTSSITNSTSTTKPSSNNKKDINDDDYCDSESDNDDKLTNNNINNNTESEKEEEQEEDDHQEEKEKEKENNRNDANKPKSSLVKLTSNNNSTTTIHKKSTTTNNKPTTINNDNKKDDNDNNEEERQITASLTPNSKLFKKGDSKRWMAVEGASRSRITIPINLLQKETNTKSSRSVTTTSTTTSTTNTTSSKGKPKSSNTVTTTTITTTTKPTKEKKSKKQLKQEEQYEEHEEEEEYVPSSQDSEISNKDEGSVNYIRPISFAKAKQIISQYTKTYEKPIDDSDFSNLSKEKLNIKKALDIACSYRWTYKCNTSKVSPLSFYFLTIPKVSYYSAEFLREYYAYIESPMSLTTMINKLKNDEHYKLNEFLVDLQLIETNALIFNDQRTDVIWTLYTLQYYFFSSLLKFNLMPQSDFDSFKLKYDSNIKLIESSLGNQSPMLTTCEETVKSIDNTPKKDSKLLKSNKTIQNNQEDNQEDELEISQIDDSDNSDEEFDEQEDEQEENDDEQEEHEEEEEEQEEYEEDVEEYERDVDSENDEEYERDAESDDVDINDD